MLLSSDIEVWSFPVGKGFLGSELLVVAGIHVSKIVPTGTSPLGHGVGFACRPYPIFPTRLLGRSGNELPILEVVPNFKPISDIL